MEKLYNRIDWVNDTVPALNANNLNSMSKALDDIDNRLVSIANNMYDLIGLDTVLESADYVEKSNVALSTSGTTTVVFESNLIKATSVIDPWISVDEITYESITTVRGECTIVVSRVSTATTVTMRIYFK